MTTIGNKLRTLRMSPGAFVSWERPIGFAVRVRMGGAKFVNYCTAPFVSEDTIRASVEKRTRLLLGNQVQRPKPNLGDELRFGSVPLRMALANLTEVQIHEAYDLLQDLEYLFRLSEEVQHPRPAWVQFEVLPKGKELEKIHQIMLIASSYMEKFTALLSPNEPLEIRALSARIIGYVGCRHPQKTKNALRVMEPMFQNLLRQYAHNPYNGGMDNNLALMGHSIALAYFLIAREDASLLRPYRATLEQGSHFWELHISSFCSDVLRYLEASA